MLRWKGRRCIAIGREEERENKCEREEGNLVLEV